MLPPDDLTQRLALVHQRIQKACERSRRDPSSVKIIGVTKGIPSDRVALLLALGITDIGENRVQEARAKHGTLEAWLGARGSGVGAVTQSAQPPTQSAFQLRWHLIGHLQRNKAKEAVKLFEVIHSVDSPELIEELERQADRLALGSKLQASAPPMQPAACSLPPIEVFIQVNVSGEAAKFGCRPEEIEELAGRLMRCAHLRLSGLMTIAPLSDNPDGSRIHFRRLRQLRDELQGVFSAQPLCRFATLPLKLSMGMSQDFEVAIEEGADLVRLGTAIFGPREPRKNGDVSFFPPSLT